MVSGIPFYYVMLLTYKKGTNTLINLRVLFMLFHWKRSQYTNGAFKLISAYFHLGTINDYNCYNHWEECAFLNGESKWYPNEPDQSINGWTLYQSPLLFFFFLFSLFFLYVTMVFLSTTSYVNIFCRDASRYVLWLRLSCLIYCFICFFL